MIRIVGEHGARSFETISEQPLIYLDHWALRLFSSDPPLRQMFFDAFKRGGTLLFSIMNVAELAANRGQSADDIRSFLADVGPHWAAITVNPSRVVQEEARLDPPEGDRSVCFGYAMIRDQWFQSKLATGDLTLAHVVDMTRGEDGDKVRVATSKHAQELLAEIERLRAAYTEDPKSLDRAYPVPSWNPRQPMKFVYYGLMRLIVKETFKLDENHARDLLHAAVATTVAQMLLLDPHWATLIRKLKLPENYVHVYSMGDVPRFLAQLAGLPTTR